MVYLVITIVLAVLVAIVIFYLICIKSKTKEVDGLVLYKDYVFVVDLSNKIKPRIRFCYIVDRDFNTGEVKVKCGLDGSIRVAVWKKNNFYFKDQLEDSSDTLPRG